MKRRRIVPSSVLREKKSQANVFPLMKKEHFRSVWRALVLSLSVIQSQWQIGLLTTIMAGQHLSLSLSIAYTYIHAQVLTCICQFSLCFSFVVDVYCALVCAELALLSRAPITAWLRPTPECQPVTVFSLVITPKSVNCTLLSFIFLFYFHFKKRVTHYTCFLTFCLLRLRVEIFPQFVGIVVWNLTIHPTNKQKDLFFGVLFDWNLMWLMVNYLKIKCNVGPQLRAMKFEDS